MCATAWPTALLSALAQVEAIAVAQIQEQVYHLFFFFASFGTPPMPANISSEVLLCILILDLKPPPTLR